jgi:hypothetical protein
LRGRDVDPCSAVVAAACAHSTEEERSESEVGEQSQGSDWDDRDGADEDVVVVDVAQLVGEDAFEFGAVHELEQADGHRD